MAEIEGTIPATREYFPAIKPGRWIPFLLPHAHRHVIDWFSKKRRERERKEAQEKALRASLAAKLLRYEQAHHGENSAASDDDHTELMVDGKKLRVSKNQITLTDVNH